MRQLVILCFLTFGLTACTGGDKIVLLPDDDGSVGKIALNPGGAEVVMDQPLQTAEVAENRAPRLGSTERAAVQSEFARAIGSMPRPPIEFTLHFESDSWRLNEASLARLPDIAVAIREQEPAEVVVVGHTDTAGEVAYNDELSLRRAAEVRQQLIDAGLQASRIFVWGRGEREPIDPGDERHSEVNRRAEVFVR